MRGVHDGLACSRNLGRMRSEIAWYVLEAANLPWSPWVDEILFERGCKANFYKNLQLAGGLIAAQVDISRVGAEFAGGRRGWGRSAPEEPIQGVDGISNIDPVITI